MIELLKQINVVLQCTAFVVAIVGVPIAVWKFFEDGRRQRQATADGLYQRYLELAMAHPELSWPKGTIPNDERYPWLVAIMLNAVGAQIICKPKRDMRDAIKADLLAHEKYLQSEDFKNEGGWSLFPKELREVYDQSSKPKPTTTSTGLPAEC